MRKMFVSVMTVALACSSIAFAAQGRQPKTADGVTIQNAAAIAPTPAAARCDNHVSATKGVLRSYSTSGYTQISYKAVNTTTGADVAVKRKLNNNTAYMPGASGTITNDKPISGSWAVTKIVLDRYSTATPAAITTCIDRQ